MGLIDDTFAPIPTSLLADWGQNITYIKTVTPRTYDPTTGNVTGADTTVTVRVGRGDKMMSMACRTAAASASEAPPNL